MPLPSVGGVSTRTRELKDWQHERAVLLPGVDACALDDQRLMRELRRIESQARLRALAIRQRKEQQQQQRLPSPELAMLRAASEELSAAQIGQEAIDWIDAAAERAADDYIGFMANLVAAREYVEDLQNEQGLVRASVSKFGPTSLVRRVDADLGPAPTAAQLEYCTLARAHRPTVWAAFCRALRFRLRQRYFQDDGGSYSRSWQASREWRVAMRLQQLNKRLNGGATDGMSRRQARELRSIEYRMQAARTRRLNDQQGDENVARPDGAEGRGGGAGGGVRAWHMRPTRKQRAAMATTRSGASLG